MTDDVAVYGESGGYVPCGGAASALDADISDGYAVAGESGAYVAKDQSADAAPDEGLDGYAVAGTSEGYVAKPCEECDSFEEFTDDAVSGWGSDTDGAWGFVGDGSASVVGGYGRMDFTIPAGAIDGSREARLDTLSNTLRTNAPWEMRSRFSAATIPAPGVITETIIAFTVLNASSNDQSVVTFYFAEGGTNGYGSLQVDENGTTIYDSGLLPNPITFDTGGAFHDLRWVFTPGGTQQVYFDEALILSGPAFTYNIPSSATNTFLEVQGLLNFAGGINDGAVSTLLFDYIRFC